MAAREPVALEEALAEEVEGFASDGWVGYSMALSGIIPLALAVMTLQFDNRRALPRDPAVVPGTA